MKDGKIQLQKLVDVYLARHEDTRYSSVIIDPNSLCSYFVRKTNKIKVWDTRGQFRNYRYDRNNFTSNRNT